MQNRSPNMLVNQPNTGIARTQYYGFQGMEKDDEVSGKGNSYTAEFWQYDSRLGRRWNIYPVVKHHESPYAAFANNPIWFIDPSGADTLKFDNAGKDIDRIKSEMNVLVVGEKSLTLGKNNENPLTKRKQLEHVWKYNEVIKESKETKNITIDVLQFSNQLQAQETFEFLAKNIPVEFGYIETSIKNEKTLQYFITTSHEESTERGTVVLRDRKLLKQNYTIYTMTHSHPKNTPRPSGLGGKKNKKDMGFLMKTNEMYKKSNLIRYEIFLPGFDKYILYNENSEAKDFQ